MSIDECVMTWRAKLRWVHYVYEVRLTLSIAFHQATSKPYMATQRPLGVGTLVGSEFAGMNFDFSSIEIGYAEFVIGVSDNVRPTIALLSAELRDGQPVHTMNYTFLPPASLWP